MVTAEGNKMEYTFELEKVADYARSTVEELNSAGLIKL